MSLLLDAFADLVRPMSDARFLPGNGPDADSRWNIGARFVLLSLSTVPSPKAGLANKGSHAMALSVPMVASPVGDLNRAA
jgi:hypothetical protein